MMCEQCGKDDRLKVKKTEKFDTVNVRIVYCSRCDYAFSTYETYENPFRPQNHQISMPQSA